MSKAVTGVGVVVASKRFKLNEEQITILNRRAESAKALLSDLLFTIIKWLFASLLAINSAGVFSVVNADDIGSSPTIWSSLWFVLGILFALLSGFSALLQIGKYMPNQAAFLELKPGEYSEDELSEITESQVDAPDEWRDPIILFGFASFFCFCGGIGILVEAIT